MHASLYLSFSVLSLSLALSLFSLPCLLSVSFPSSSPPLTTATIMGTPTALRLSLRCCLPKSLKPAAAENGHCTLAAQQQQHLLLFLLQLPLHSHLPLQPQLRANNHSSVPHRLLLSVRSWPPPLLYIPTQKPAAAVTAAAATAAAAAATLLLLRCECLAISPEEKLWRL